MSVIILDPSVPDATAQALVRELRAVEAYFRLPTTDVVDPSCHTLIPDADPAACREVINYLTNHGINFKVESANSTTAPHRAPAHA